MHLPIYHREELIFNGIKNLYITWTNLYIFISISPIYFFHKMLRCFTNTASENKEIGNSVEKYLFLLLKQLLLAQWCISKQKLIFSLVSYAIIWRVQIHILFEHDRWLKKKKSLLSRLGYFNRLDEIVWFQLKVELFLNCVERR